MNRAEKVKAHLEAKELRKKEMAEFKIPQEIAAKVEHSMPHLIVFEYHGSRMDLTKVSANKMLQLAAAKDCPVLNLKDSKSAPAAKAPEPEKTTEQPKAKEEDKNAGKK